MLFLILPVLIPAPGGLAAQSTPERAFSFPILPPRVLLPPTVGPTGLPVRPPILPPGTIGFPQLAQAAGSIFSGTVTAIARHPATKRQAIETVAITYHVEHAIRGVTPGEDFTISQWIGLWSGGQRYRVGDHLLLFLYPPSKLGLTSCVAGALGRFALDPRGRVLLSAQHLSAFRADPVLGGKSQVSLSSLALAVQRAGPRSGPQFEPQFEEEQ